jgi:uncharacterized protein YbaP (TraB family)
MMPALAGGIFTKREAQWLPKLTMMATEGRRIFVLVGVNHLAGANGLVKKMQAHGIRLERL